ncbi:spinster family MFS transporter [Paludibaculum fermentans]|uniref:MFS transporter n=1 Tax=Paludibaculum fermentans TaxID=1473598 RepID=A0A7S7NKY3_PALFE|nr:MFS transporter [Paludibaculum fermentans]QOY85546.1 MFS transporter [Paludibaculum fermentans]
MQPEGATSGSRAWIALGMLTFVYVLNFLSRQLPSILASKIQESLHVSDAELGLIGGLYFALFYCGISVPVARLADRTNRSLVLTAACAVWSAATMFCGTAGSYLQFVAGYMTVGFGEAGGVPPSYSIICDYFPTGRRGTALGVFNFGPALGAALGIAFGASIAAAYSWRYAFLFLGGAGVLTAIAIPFVIHEPRRGALDGLANRPLSSARTSFGESLRLFFSRRSLLLAGLAAGANQLVTYGLSNFSVLFLMREKGMTLREVAVWYSLTVVIAMGASMFVCGRIIDRFARRTKLAYALAPAISLSLAIPWYLAFVWAPAWRLALPLLAVTIFLNYFYLSAMVTLVQEQVRADQRVMSGALLLLVMNFIGLGLGPTYVGSISQFFRATHPQNSLQIALYALTPFYLVAVFLFLMLARVLRRESAASGETAP